MLLCFAVQLIILPLVLLKMYSPTTRSTVPILSLVLEFCIKHSVEEKISSHLSDAVN